MYLEYEKCLWIFETAQMARLYSLTKIIGGFILPLVIIFTCYIYIYAKTRNLVTGSSRSGGRSDHLESAMSRLILIIILTFIITWLPNQTLNLVITIEPDAIRWPLIYERHGPLTQVKLLVSFKFKHKSS